MAIELTDKIAPKNAAFADIVDAKNVGGDGTSANALQADAVATPAASRIVRVDSGNSYLEAIASVPVANGGTGATTLTGYVKGSGTSALTAAATVPGSDVSGNISGNAANVTGTVAVANGGTGQTTYTDGQLLIGNTTGGTLAKGTITAGTGITVTNGAGSITIAATGGGGSMVYPGAGIANSTGSAWDTSITTSAGLRAAISDEKGTGSALFDSATGVTLSGAFTQETNNVAAFKGKPSSGSVDYSFFVNSSNEWELRKAVGGVFNATYKFGNDNVYAEGGEDLGITTKGWGALWLKGSSSGESKLVAPSASGATNTLPAFTATIGGRVASYDGTALTASASNQLLASATAGFYRLSVFMICTRAAAVSSLMGENTNVTYTPSGGAGPVTHYVAMFAAGSAISADVGGYSNPAADVILHGNIVLNIASASTVTYNNNYTSSGTGTAMMRYNVSVRLERID